MTEVLTTFFVFILVDFGDTFGEQLTY